RHSGRPPPPQRHRRRPARGGVVDGGGAGGAFEPGFRLPGHGEDPPRLGNRHPSIAPYQTFEAADGWFVVACGNDNQFRALAGVCDLDHLAGDERFSTNTARVANVDALDEILTDTFRRQPVAHWVHELNRAGVPAGPINTVGQAFRLAADLGL